MAQFWKTVKTMGRRLWQILKQELVFVLVLGFICTLWITVHASFKHLVVGKTTDYFNSSRARQHLERIANVGPRPTGSVQNDIITVNYLLEQVEQIRSESAAGPNVITVDTQKPSGSFSTRWYNQITNVVVRLEPEAGAQHFILANCHFDSVPNSPGASDNAVSCALMLEVLHSLSSLSAPLKHGVMFLFNGAEETGLQASHGFITQHAWVKQIRAFVNLDSAGVGGKELVFQTGPENPWLIQAYADSVKHPFASVVGQEIFQSNLIPSDTDFRIFRYFGHIPGIDMAFIENGYLYHTKYDTPDRIPTDSIQRAGDNILAFLKHVVNSEMLADLSAYSSGSMVFFDILGLTMMIYSARVGTILNCMVAIGTLIYLATKYCRCCNLGLWVRLLHLALATVVQFVSWVMALTLVLIVAWVIVLMGRSMFWFSYFYASICLYGSTAVGTILLFHTFLRKKYRVHKTLTTESQQISNKIYRLDFAELFFDSSLLLWCCSLIVLTIRDFCSAYVPMLMVVFPLVFKLLLLCPFRCRGVPYLVPLFCLLSLFIPYVHLFYLFRIIFVMFIPIMGRASYAFPTEIVVALIIAIPIVLLSSFLIHFLYLAQCVCTKRVLAAVFSVFALSLLLVSCGLFFPYSADPAMPRPKRIDVQHITRSFHALDGSLERTDSGFLINNFDDTKMSHITPHIPEINDTISFSCNNGMSHFPWLPPNEYCKTGWYLPAPAVSPKSPLVLKQVSKRVTEHGTVRLDFEAKGPSHLCLYVLPQNGSSITNGSFGNWISRLNLFYSHGVNAGPWYFWIEVQPPSDQPKTESIVSIAVSAHYVIGEDQSTPELRSLLPKFPDWAFTSSWVSTYHMYKY